MSGDARCPDCLDTGHVCEDHPHHPWAGTADVEECCGGAGMPCPSCCSEIPQGAGVSIRTAFTPDWLRPAVGHKVFNRVTKRDHCNRCDRMLATGQAACICGTRFDAPLAAGEPDKRGVSNGPDR